MPFFKEILTDRCHGGIWKITEPWEELCRLLPRADSHYDYVRRHFRSEKRCLEYVAVRVLLYRLTGEDREILYYPSGRPYFKDSSCGLSISHTSGYAAVLLSETGRIGVDIEAYSPRVIKLKSRIAGPDESADTVYELLLHWSAKETAFKILDEPGIDFIRHLRVEDLSCAADDRETDREGIFKLSYHLADGREGHFPVSYLTTSDFVLTTAYGGRGMK